MKLILEKESVNFEKKIDKLRILQILINVNVKKKKKNWHKCEFLRKIWILDKRAIMWILDVKVNFGQKCEFWT